MFEAGFRVWQKGFVKINKAGTSVRKCEGNGSKKTKKVPTLYFLKSCRVGLGARARPRVRPLAPPSRVIDRAPPPYSKIAAPPSSELCRGQVPQPILAGVAAPPPTLSLSCRSPRWLIIRDGDSLLPVNIVVLVRDARLSLLKDSPWLEVVIHTVQPQSLHFCFLSIFLAKTRFLLFLFGHLIERVVGV